MHIKSTFIFSQLSLAAIRYQHQIELSFHSSWFSCQPPKLFFAAITWFSSIVALRFSIIFFVPQFVSSAFPCFLCHTFYGSCEPVSSFPLLFPLCLDLLPSTPFIDETLTNNCFLSLIGDQDVIINRKTSFHSSISMRNHNNHSHNIFNRAVLALSRIRE